MFKSMLLIPLMFLLVQCTNTPTVSQEDLKPMKGKIIALVKMTKTFKLQTKKKTFIISYSDDTKFENVKDANGLHVPAKVAVMVDKKMRAHSLKLMLVKLPKEMIITTNEIVDLMDSGKKFFIGDARPMKKYNIGHIKGAKLATPDMLKKSTSMLPKDKNTLLVFYCGGTSCPLSPKAGNIAKKKGWKNVKVYVDGYPAWKAETYPVYVGAKAVSKKLNKHSVILDVRANPTKHIKGAVHFPTAKLDGMNENFAKNKTPKKMRFLPGVKYKKAPIFIYADKMTDDAAVEALEFLNYWGYKKVAIIETSFKKWASMYPTSTKKIATNITYVKKLMPGSATIEDFIAAAKTGKFLIVDVREDKEVAKGKLANSIHIPLGILGENLNKIPKDKRVIIHCAGGARASMAYDLLKEKGYKNVSYLDESPEAVCKEHSIKF